jgi:hypothetical protein
VAPQKLFKETVENGESNIPSYEVLSCEVNNLTKDLIDIILTSFGQEYFTIKLIDKNQKVLNDLSFGEQQLIFILNQLFALKYEKFSGIEKVESQDVDIEKDINNFIVLLDEIDIGFHPDWQKRAIQYVCDFLKLIPEKKFHLVFTTHSPFLLSDLPKENVIFLEKYKKNEEKDQKDGNCKNVTKETNIETFGANIHTLLSNGFFMNDGLMGVFAKSKINEVYNFIVQKDTNFIKTKKEAQNIINLIGEPLIQKQLQKLFDETFDKTNLTLDDEIELLEKKLNALKELKK